MWKTIKLHKFFILAIIIVLCLIGHSFFSYFNEYYYEPAKGYHRIKEICYEQQDWDHPYCENFAHNKDHLEEWLESHDPSKEFEQLDVITLTSIIVEHYSFASLQYFSPLIIAIAVAGMFHSHLKSGMFENYLLRMDYKKYLRKIYRISLKAPLIMPVALIVIFLISCLITGFNFDTSSVNSNMSVYSAWKYEHFFLYGAMICLIQVFMSLVYANITLYCCRKNKNLLVAIVMSYIFFLVLDLFVYLVLYSLILNRIFGIKELTDYFNIAGYWFFKEDSNGTIPLIVAFSLQLVSFLGLHQIFKRKERLVLEYEKQVS